VAEAACTFCVFWW